MSTLKHSHSEPSVIPHHLLSLGAPPLPKPDSTSGPLPFIYSFGLSALSTSVCQLSSRQKQLCPECLLPAFQSDETSPTCQGSEHPLLGCFPGKQKSPSPPTPSYPRFHLLHISYMQSTQDRKQMILLTYYQAVNRTLMLGHMSTSFPSLHLNT